MSDEPPTQTASSAVAPSRTALRRSSLAPLLGDVRGGLVASLTCFAFSISNGGLIYSAGAPGLLGVGIAAGFLTTALSAVVIALTSTFKPAVATANSATAAPLAAVVVSTAPALAHLPPETAAATVVAIVAVATSLTGLVMVLLGVGRLGKIVRFLPFPVMAGFMGVTGALTALGSIRFGTGVRVAWAELPKFLDANTAALLGLTVGFAITTNIVTRRFKHPLALPGLLLATVLVADAFVYATGHTIEAPPLSGLFLALRPSLHLGWSLLAAVPHGAQWALIPPLAGAIAAYAIVIVMATLLSSSGLEAALNVDADYDRELRAQGLACLASSLGGGFVGNSSLGITLAGVASGARGRATGITNGVVMVVAGFVALPLIAYVPRFVIAGLLGHVGLSILITWCVKTRTRMPRGEWLLVVGIVAITIWAGLVAAVFAGLVAGCVLFAIDVSRIGVVRRDYGLDRRASTVVRPSEELAVLSREGGRIRFIELSGMLFFGSAYQLMARVKQLVAKAPPDAIVLDLTAVSGCDSSATAVIARMRKLLARDGLAFAVAGGSAPILALLRSSGCLSPGDAVYAAIDEALEAAEVALLRADADVAAAPTSLRHWLSRALDSEPLATALIDACRREDHAAGDYLCREGEPSDTLLFIETGRVGVMIGPPTAQRCVRIFGPHTIAGEHGFVLGLPRTASLRVEQPSRVFVLERARFAAIQAERPELAIALLRDIVRLQSERLAFATRQNAMLA